MARGDPKRTRISVLHKTDHIGYLTTTSYPDRDLTAFSEGSPYFEIVVSDLHEKHVALLQRYKEHWLVHCGSHYDTTDAAGALSDAQMMALAVFALRHRDHLAPVLVAALKGHVERMLMKT